MRLVQVQSSNIQAVGYDRETEEMKVVFHTGAEYTYADVPEEVFDGLIKAPSVGSYFYAYVRDKYDYARAR